ncbi:alpha/beta fold hydrolase [Streptomyces sp. NPDC092370]|uniref:alpha/beta fold hydrolase n=1 Tax=Streptomyces sp. NPDC092370 TaxID=3366016 RepID=UPI003821749C
MGVRGPAHPGRRTESAHHGAERDLRATSDGVTIHYEEQGSGPPLVLLHGWGFSGRFSTRNVDALAEHARVITG